MGLPLSFCQNCFVLITISRKMRSDSIIASDPRASVPSLHHQVQIRKNTPSNNLGHGAEVGVDGVGGAVVVEAAGRLLWTLISCEREFVRASRHFLVYIYKKRRVPQDFRCSSFFALSHPLQCLVYPLSVVAYHCHSSIR